MSDLSKPEKVANIIAFLLLIFNEDYKALEKIMNFSPDYIIEKFERYVLSSRQEWPWGMHPVLRNGLFQAYVDAWKMELCNE